WAPAEPSGESNHAPEPARARSELSPTPEPARASGELHPTPESARASGELNRTPELASRTPERELSEPNGPPELDLSDAKDAPEREQRDFGSVPGPEPRDSNSAPELEAATRRAATATATAPARRHVGAAVRREMWARDGGRRAYTDDRGGAGSRPVAWSCITDARMPAADRTRLQTSSYEPGPAARRAENRPIHPAADPIRPGAGTTNGLRRRSRYGKDQGIHARRCPDRASAARVPPLRGGDRASARALSLGGAGAQGRARGGTSAGGGRRSGARGLVGGARRARGGGAHRGGFAHLPSDPAGEAPVRALLVRAAGRRRAPAPDRIDPVRDGGVSSGRARRPLRRRTVHPVSAPHARPDGAGGPAQRARPHPRQRPAGHRLRGPSAALAGGSGRSACPLAPPAHRLSQP